MNFSKLLEFPGILILVGALLLIIALIIGIVSMRKSKKEGHEEVVEPKQDIMDIKVEETTPVIEEPVTEEPIMEEAKLVIEQGPEPIIEEPIEKPILEEFSQPIEEVKEQQEEIKPIELEPIHRSAYGGVDPKDKISFSFEKPASDNTPYSDTAYTVNPVPTINTESQEPQMLVEDSSKEVNIEDEEEVETL